MKILFFLHQFYPEFKGGTEKVTLNLARAAQRNGHHVCILAATLNPDAKLFAPSENFQGALEGVYDGLPVMLLPRRLLAATAGFGLDADDDLARRIVIWLTREKFDLAHGMHAMRMTSTLAALQSSGVPYVLTLTDFFYECYRVNLMNAQGRICDGPDGGARCLTDCPVPEFSAKKFKKRYQQGADFLAHAKARIVPSRFVSGKYRKAFPELDFQIIPHGIDMIRMAAASRPELPARCDLPTSGDSAGRPDVILSFIGTLAEHKGAHVLLEALAKVPDARVHLRLAGGFYGNDAYEARIRAFVAADARALLLGELSADAVAAELAAADVLCLPSLVPETFSLILHEAAASGVPALVSSLGAPADFIGDHGGGEVIEAGNADAWAEAVSQLAQQHGKLTRWQQHLPLPSRVEEEAFFYQSVYYAARG